MLVRAGHTEAAVDIARLVGCCRRCNLRDHERRRHDGADAGPSDVCAASRSEIGTISDLIAYRRRKENYRARCRGARHHAPYGGPFKLRVYVNSVDNTEHLALIKGDVANGEPVLVRMHAVNILEDLLGMGRNGNRRSLVERAMRRIGQEGRGVVVVIRDVREGVIGAR